jgi:hypothetical protein
MHHPFPLLSYPVHICVVVGGCGGLKCTISSAELAVCRDFERSLKSGSNPSTRATGTGFWWVQKSVPRPVPQVNPWQNPRVLKTRDIPYSL